jgi:DNA-binding transcriptional MerR regulator
VTHTVKDTAARVGLPSRTLRYYDRIGLVCPPRTPSGYRVYGPEEEGRLRFVRQAKTLGFSLAEIRELIAAAFGLRCGEDARAP